jgi:hypothetical protein
MAEYPEPEVALRPRLVAILGTQLAFWRANRGLLNEDPGVGPTLFPVDML